MPIVDPQSIHNPTVGQPIPSSWGDAVRDGIMYLAANSPHVRVYNSANESINNITETLLTFNSERWDVGGNHSTSSLTGRLTVQSGEGGIYTMHGMISWAANGTGDRAVIIRLNGSTHIGRVRQNAVTGGPTHEQLVSTDFLLAAADYVDLAVYQSSGGALNVLNANAYSPEFSMAWSSQ